MKTTEEKLKEYLKYYAEVGDLCQMYTTSSVMLLDNAHHIGQHQEQCSWHNADHHTRHFYLEKRPDLSMTSGSGSKKNEKTPSKHYLMDNQG